MWLVYEGEIFYPDMELELIDSTQTQVFFEAKGLFLFVLAAVIHLYYFIHKM